MSDDLERRLRARYQRLTPTGSSVIETRVRASLVASSGGRAWSSVPGLAAVLVAIAACVVLVVGVYPAWVAAPAAPGANIPGTESATDTGVAFDVGLSGVDESGAIASGGTWALRGSLLVASTDNGGVWQQLPLPAGPTPIAIEVYDLATAFIVQKRGNQISSGQESFTVSRTSDSGRTWLTSEIAAQTGVSHASLLFTDDRSGFLLLYGGGNDQSLGTVFKTIDGAATWTEASSAPLSTSLLSQTDANSLWAGSTEQQQPSRATLSVSRDAGLTWEAVGLRSTGGLDPATGLSVIVPPTSTGQGVVAVVLAGSAQSSRMWFLTTYDSGLNWVSEQGPQALADSLDAVAVVDQSHWYVAQAGSVLHLYASDDGGRSWHEVKSSGFGSDWWVRWMAFSDPLNGVAEVGLGQKHPGANGLLITSDGGRTWTPANFGSSVPNYEASGTKGP
jgi:hypothetical protein